MQILSHTFTNANEEVFSYHYLLWVIDSSFISTFIITLIFPDNLNLSNFLYFKFLILNYKFSYLIIA